MTVEEFAKRLSKELRTQADAIAKVMNRYPFYHPRRLELGLQEDTYMTISYAVLRAAGIEEGGG